jgi:cell division protein FtsZ
MEEQLTLNTRDKTTEDLHELKPKITVIGIGGAGGNAVNNMIRYQLEGVEFITGNTDAQALVHSLAPHRLQLGLEITQGLGAGSRPDVGKAAAEETVAEVMSKIKGSHMVFITAGMGGGTGTGAAPVIAKAAREAGILTVGVVTKPFHFEGSNRMKSAEKGIIELQQYVDTLIVIPNQNLFRIANERTTLADAFKMADDVLYSGVRGVTDLMIMPGLINLDFADIRSVMGEMGKAMMGTGEAEGENRAIEAAEAAISNPLLDDVSMRGARGVLINITGGYDMTLFEVDEAANRIRQEVDPEANIIFGSTFDEKMEGVIRVSVVATGIDAESTQHRSAAARSTSHSGFGSTHPMPEPVVAQHGIPQETHEEFDDELTATASNESLKSSANHHEEMMEESRISEEPYRKARKLSFFERLTGRRHQPELEEDHLFHKPAQRSKTKVRADEDLNLDEGEELEIPAFLRRKK